MGEFWLIIFLAVVAACIFIVPQMRSIWPPTPENLRRFFTKFFAKSSNVDIRNSQQSTEVTEPVFDGTDLNCIVDYDSTQAKFLVRISGLILSPEKMQTVVVKLTIKDVTDPFRPLPVHSKRKREQMLQNCMFGMGIVLGKIPSLEMRLDNWIQIAAIENTSLVCPRSGRRVLEFDINVLAKETGIELASAWWPLVYENSETGYIDIFENLERTRTLAVALAFSVSAVDEKIDSAEIDVIKRWSKDNIDFGEASQADVKQLEKALDKTADFFKAGNRLDVTKICSEIARIACLADRYDVLELCMIVAAAKGSVDQRETELLKNMVQWLELDDSRFRAMMQKIMPLSGAEPDIEMLLGLTPEMDTDQTKKLLNNEYRKWNSRVTSADPTIRRQADQMLKFIAHARVSTLATC